MNSTFAINSEVPPPCPDLPQKYTLNPRGIDFAHRPEWYQYYISVNPLYLKDHATREYIILAAYVALSLQQWKGQPTNNDDQASVLVNSVKEVFEKYNASAQSLHKQTPWTEHHQNVLEMNNHVLDAVRAYVDHVPLRVNVNAVYEFFNPKQQERRECIAINNYNGERCKSGAKIDGMCGVYRKSAKTVDGEVVRVRWEDLLKNKEGALTKFWRQELGRCAATTGYPKTETPATLPLVFSAPSDTGVMWSGLNEWDIAVWTSFMPSLIDGDLETNTLHQMASYSAFLRDTIKYDRDLIGHTLALQLDTAEGHHAQPTETPVINPATVTTSSLPTSGRDTLTQRRRQSRRVASTQYGTPLPTTSAAPYPFTFSIPAASDADGTLPGNTLVWRPVIVSAMVPPEPEEALMAFRSSPSSTRKKRARGKRVKSVPENQQQSVDPKEARTVLPRFGSVTNLDQGGTR